MSNYKVIGLMSGTSLDGVDLAYCIFKEENNKWSFSIECAETIAYSEVLKKTLREIENSTTFDFISFHKEYGSFLGKLSKTFIEKNQLEPDFIASHGHTIFHQPENKITFQIGDGAALAAECGIQVISDFRSLDVALGGQGAPLVPIGDKLLFGDYNICLNIGGIANVSFDKGNDRLAFDICPVNIVLNYLSQQTGKECDDKGEMSAKGKINQALLKELNAIEFYSLTPPKSLGKEWVQRYIFPILKSYSIPVEDKLNTYCEHVSFQIANSFKEIKQNKILVTGGGVYNDFLMSRIKAQTQHEIVIPEKKIIEFKEALIFAFLGVLRVKNFDNCLQSVTGALKNNCGGSIYQG